MKNPDIKLAVSLVTATVAIALLLTGITWLYGVGIVCISLGYYFELPQAKRSKYSKREAVLLFLCAVVVVSSFIVNWEKGDIFKREPMWIGLRIILIGTWLWVVIPEILQWRANRKTANAA